MLFLVVTEVEAHCLGDRVFESFAEARSCYDDCAHVCMEGPDESAGADPSIVTNCWLYSVEAADAGSAKRQLMLGNMVLIEACFPTD